MRSDLMALRLVLDALEVPLDIGSLDARKRVQKAVYLVQKAGLGLGYSYGWYIYGPYSTQLTSDYYALEGEKALSASDGATYRLVPAASAVIEQVRPLLTVPTSIGNALKPEDWLELLASYHFLRDVSGYDDAVACESLRTHPRKSRLAPYAAQARDALLAAKLLPN